MNQPVILGGGVAGIAAAVELAEAGAEPILIESRPYLGGRVRSFVHRETGDEIDNGRHLMMGSYRETFALLDRLGTRHLLAVQPALRVGFRHADGSTDLLAASSRLPSPLNVLLGMMGLRRLSLRERLGLIRVGLDAKGKGPGERETVADYLHRLGQSRTVCERLGNPLVIAVLNTVPERASARLFAEVMRLAFMGKGEDSRLVFPLVGLSRLLEPARDRIALKGGTVLTGCYASDVGRENGEWNVVLRDGRTFQTRGLLSALPWHEFAELFGKKVPERKDDPVLLSPPRHNPIISLYLWFDRSLNDLPEFGAMLGTRVEWVFNRRKISGESNERFPGLLECVISAADDLVGVENDRIAGIVEQELRGAFAGLRGTALLAVQVIKEKRATFEATPPVEAIRPVPGRFAEGLFVAGDWTGTGLPGTIEGAVLSGRLAAHALLADVG